jgi:phosphatidylinositol alpha-1,6-mannosyltransferase
MKVLLYTHEFPPFLGGLATTSLKLARGISGSGIETLVLAPGYGPQDGGIDGKLGCRVIRIRGLGSKWIKAIPYADTVLGFFSLMSVLRNEKPDIVLFITEEAEAAGGLVPDISFVPVVRVAGSGITTCFYGNRVMKRLMRHPMRRLYRNSERIIAVSRNTKGLLESIGVPGDAITVIYNGVSEEMLSRASDAGKLKALRARHGIREGAPVIITIARILPRKGQDMVIMALPLIKKEFPDIVYLVVGEGRFKKKFEELAGDLGVSKSVVFTGGVSHEEIIDYLDLADVFVMPSRKWDNKVEGLPNALIEASARGKPVIAGNQGGSLEAVRDGITGILVDPESVTEIAEAVCSLLRDPGKAGLMGESGREMVRQLHTETAMIEKYVDLLITALDKKSRRSNIV